LNKPDPIHKGSEILRALFFWRFRGEARGCDAGGVVPETPEMDYFWPGAVSVLRLPCGYGPVEKGRSLFEDFLRMSVPAPLQVLPGGEGAPLR